MTQDIALIALALAHGADDRLDRTEVDEIARRLDKWRRDPASPTALAAMKHALDAYAGCADHGDVDDAIARLGACLDASERADLFSDLVGIARADQQLEPGEKDFLRSIRGAWGLEA